MFGGIDAYWLWLGLAGILLIAELLAPGVFLAWIAAAAALTGVATFAFGLALPFQLVLFALFAIAAVLAGRRAYDRNPIESSDPMLNDRMARLRGETLVLATDIVDGRGRAHVGDGVWPVKGPDAVSGSRVRVVGADGSFLEVEPIDSAPLPPPA